MNILFRINLLFFILLVTAFQSASGVQAQQRDSLIIAEIQHYQDSLENDFKDPELSPLLPKDFKNFEGLDFYPIDLNYYIIADFVRTPDQQPFTMPTTRKRKEPAIYEKYGEVHFTLDGEKIELPVFQSHSLREQEEWKNYLFLPFKDATNGKQTYGGGRYVELWYTGGDTILVDFNRAYNPYCAYNYNYSCPIVPKTNRMPVAVTAGERNFKKPQ